ncbi:NAD(P)H-dependent oxidoreductase, partial [Rhizobium leguminosarum]|uniref:NAD(P)H-dependent oxidoreductase n=1 Tax=Rhizobium leguminosarum TaxID=384 RepID=UPI003F9490EC
AAVARTAREALEASSHVVDLLDIYAENFDPRLSKAERGGYFEIPYDTSAVADIVARLKDADGLIFVFPQWWFNFPAMLKGF